MAYFWTNRVMTDPFACFGEEEDDSPSSPGTQGDGQQTPSTKAQELVQRANLRFVSNAVDSSRTDYASNQDDGVSVTSPHHGASDLICNGHLYDNPWSHCPSLLYRNPDLLLASFSSDGVGGGRGYVAGSDMMPGTLLLVEEPVSTWDGFYSTTQSESSLGIETLHFILFHDKDQLKTLQLVRDIEFLHPTKAQVDEYFTYTNHHLTDDYTGQLSEMDQVQIIDMMRDMLTTYSAHPCMNAIIESTLPYYQLNPVDICRMILALRYNAFESGLYLHFSMFNHSESSNCIKYMPTSDRSRTYSEARTTRHVPKGEALTLHYITPHREVSHATRRNYLWDQHRFDIGEEILPLHVREMEYVTSSFNQLPPSFTNYVDESTVTFQIEKKIMKLEEEYANLTNKIGMENSWIDLEKQTSLYILQSIQGLGNSHHILFLRLYRLHVDILHVLLKYKVQSHTVWTLIQSAKSLLDLEIQAWGRDHPDVARTHHDIANALSYILATSPKSSCPYPKHGLSTIRECSREEAYHRTEYHRIRRWYPHDVEKYMMNPT